LILRHAEGTGHVRLSPGRELSLGAGRDNDVVLAAPGVSRRHALLRPTPHGVLVADLGSKNGLIEAGERRLLVHLTPGRRLQLGRAFLMVEEIAASDAELAVAFESGAPEIEENAGDRHTSALSLDSHRSAAAVVRFLRRFEGDDLSGARARRSFLAAAREVVGAAALVALRMERAGEPVISECAGACGEAALDALERLLRAAGTSDPPAASGAWPLVVGPAGPGGLLLAAAGGRRLLAGGWRREFLAYVAERLGAAGEAGRDATTDTAATGELRPPPGMVLGDSAPIRDLLEQARAASRSRADVLLSGETGTGKELFARLLHASGPTAAGPLVAVNCAAIPADLLEAELFGVAARVATGVDPRPGLFVEADGGTLLLDEVGELPPPLQSKLLRALQEREVLPLGGRRSVPFSARLISTTNKELRDEVRTGSFRADLYYRLRGLELRVPSLRERLDDLPELASVFAREAAREQQKRLAGISSGAMRALLAHAWPGNVRELRAEIARAVLQCPAGAALERRHFAALAGPGPEEPPTPAPPLSAPPPGAAPPAWPPTLAGRLEREERRAVVEALEAEGWNLTRSARRLGVSRQGLRLKIERLGIERPRRPPG